MFKLVADWFVNCHKTLFIRIRMKPEYVEPKLKEYSLQFSTHHTFINFHSFIDLAANNLVIPTLPTQMCAKLSLEFTYPGLQEILKKILKILWKHWNSAGTIQLFLKTELISHTCKQIAVYLVHCEHVAPASHCACRWMWRHIHQQKVGNRCAFFRPTASLSRPLVCTACTALLSTASTQKQVAGAAACSCGGGLWCRFLSNFAASMVRVSVSGGCHLTSCIAYGVAARRTPMCEKPIEFIIFC